MRAILTRISRKLSRARALNQLVRSEEERDDREGDEGEAPVEPDHHPHDARRGDEVAEDGDEAGRGEELVHRVDVGGDPGHQPADRVAVEVGDVQPLQVREDLAPHVVHDALPDQLHHVALGIEHEEGEDQRGQVDQRDHGEALAGHAGRLDAAGKQAIPNPTADSRQTLGLLPGTDEQVDRHGKRQRPDELKDRGEKDQRHRPGRHPPVGPHVAEQPLHQPGVVRLAEGLLFVVGERLATWG